MALLAVVGASQSLRILRAQMYLNQGAGAAGQQATLRMAVTDLKRAYEANPADPVAASMAGSAIFNLENLRTASGTRGVDAANLELSMEFLQTASKTHDRLAEIHLIAGDAMNLATNVSLMNGDRQGAINYSKLSAEQYYRYHRIAGRAWSAPWEFYSAAIPRSIDAGRPHLALRYWQEMKRYQQQFASNELSGMLLVARASTQMGYLDQAIAGLREAAIKFPEDDRARRELVRLAQLKDDFTPAIQLFEYLDQRDQLNDGEDLLLEELYALRDAAGADSGWTPPAGE